EGDPERYLLPLTAKHADPEGEIRELSALARLASPEGDWVLFDAVFDRDSALALLDAVTRRRRFPGTEGRFAATPARTLRKILQGAEGSRAPQANQADQTQRR